MTNVGIYLSRHNVAMNKRSKIEQPKKYKIILLILAAITLLFSSYNLITNLKFINPFVKIAGQVPFAEANTRKEIRGGGRGSSTYTAYIAELVFKLKGNNRLFRLTDNITDKPDDRKYYELAKTLKQAKQVTVTILSFDSNDAEPKVYQLNIDGKVISDAETTRDNESLVFVGFFIFGIVLLLGGLGIIEMNYKH